VFEYFPGNYVWNLGVVAALNSGGLIDEVDKVLPDHALRRVGESYRQLFGEMTAERDLGRDKGLQIVALVVGSAAAPFGVRGRRRVLRIPRGGLGRLLGKHVVQAGIERLLDLGAAAEVARHPFFLNRLETVAGGTGSALAKGGMLTKVQAAKRAARSGAHTVIASGREPEVLVRLAQGERLGTLLTAQTVPLAARKQWLADHLTVTGRLRLDAGAVKAVVRDGKSLLPIGVVEVSGEFDRGAVVGCLDPQGREVARGLVNYSAAEARQIMRRPSAEIESVLGYFDEPELIHRDNLVVL